MRKGGGKPLDQFVEPEASASHPTGRRHAGLGLLVAVGVITLAGAALRLAAARGDLWLDEIWSFRLLGKVHGIAGIVFALPYDTNHVLTEIWLALVGPAASPVVVRLPAILFGTLCVPAAALIGARRGAIPALACAAVFAFDFVFIQFGSEARGYAGMILATLLAFDALEGLIGTPSARGRITFALAIGFGTFSHLTMVEPTAALCAAAVFRLVRTAGWRRAVPKVTPILAAAVIGTAPALLCFAISVLATGTLHTGLVEPPSFAAFALGLGRMLRGVIGLYDAPLTPSGATLLLTAGALGCALAVVALRRARLAFAAITIFILPCLHWALLPNQSYPRFYLTFAVGLALLIADVWTQAWRGGRAARLAGLCVAILFFSGQYRNVASLVRVHRGHYADAVGMMGDTAPASFSVLPPVQDGETNATVQWYAQRQGAPVLAHVGIAAPCKTAPDWMIIAQMPNTVVDAPPTMVTGPEGCQGPYTFRATFPAFGFSGWTWTLYHRL